MISQEYKYVVLAQDVSKEAIEKALATIERGFHLEKIITSPELGIMIFVTTNI